MTSTRQWVDWHLEEYQAVCDEWHRRHDEEAGEAEPGKRSAWRPSGLADIVRRVMGKS